MNDSAIFEINFVNLFVRKTRRDRAIWALKHPKKRHQFLDMLLRNREDVLLANSLGRLQTRGPARIYEELKTRLKLTDQDECAIVSYFDDDRGIVPLRDAFNLAQTNGYGCLLIFDKGRKYYLKTEQEQGAPWQFIGQSKPA
jgi:hypothetical protein